MLYFLFYSSFSSCSPEQLEISRIARIKLKEERQRKKQRKRMKKEKMEKCCSPRMNCFQHDRDHWRTPPLWYDDSFCFCMNSNNNTYSCIRTINATHNFLYCEFTTGLVTYYNLRIGKCRPASQLYALLTLSHFRSLRDPESRAVAVE